MTIDRRKVLAIGAMGAAALAPAFRVVSGQTASDGKETAPAGSTSETLRGHTQSLADAVSAEGQQTGRAARELRVETPDVLFSPGRPRIRYVFRRDGSGGITGFAERREAWDLDWTRIAAPRTV